MEPNKNNVDNTDDMNSQNNLFLNISKLDQNKGMLNNPPEKLVSDDITDLVEYVTAVLMLAISIIAMATNSINIRVFLKQNYKTESTTLTLLCLSVLDFLGSLNLIPISVCFLLKQLYTQKPLFVTCNTFALVTTTAIHEIAWYAATWITVYMSVERSLCVLMPLKVKLIFTPKRTLIVILAICAIFFISNSAILSFIKIIWTKHPILGYSVAVPYKSPAASQIFYMANIVMVTSMNSVALIIVFVATAMMVYKLNQTRKWRMVSLGMGKAQKTTTTKTQQSDNTNNDDHETAIDDVSTTTSTNPDGAQRGIQSKGQQHNNKGKPLATTTATTSGNSKDLEAMKTVCIVASIFLVCVSVSHISSSIVYTIPYITFNGPNGNLLTMVATFKYFFASVNASVNFFFFLRMSSRYQAVFYSLYPTFSK